MAKCTLDFKTNLMQYNLRKIYFENQNLLEGTQFLIHSLRLYHGKALVANITKGALSDSTALT